MGKTADSLTTGEIAKICAVATRTVAKWIDTGLLAGYRLPGSKERRVRRADLVEFMHRNNMLNGHSGVLIVDASPLRKSLAGSLSQYLCHSVTVVDNLYAAGVHVATCSPAVAVVNLALFPTALAELKARVARIIGLSADAAVPPGAFAVLPLAATSQQLLEAIHKAMVGAAR